MYVDWWRCVSDDPHPRNPLLVIVAADDPDAVSTLTPDHGARWRDGDWTKTSTSRVAEHLGVPIRVCDDPELPADPDLLLLAGIGRGLTSVAAQIACARFGAEPQAVVGFGSGITDVQWMEKVVDVRDRQMDTYALELMSQILASAAEREIPVLLDGAVAVAAAAITPQLPDAQVPAVSEEPAERYLIDRMEVPVWGVSALPAGEGLGALGGLAALRLGLLASHV